MKTKIDTRTLTLLHWRELTLKDCGLLYVLFSGAHVIIREPFEVYSAYVVAGFMALCALGRPGRLLSGPITFLSVLGVVGYTGAMQWPGQGGFFKVFAVIVCVVLTSSLVMALYNNDLVRLFRVYVFGCSCASFLGILQIVASKIGFQPLYNFGWLGLNKWGMSFEGPLGLRLNSLFSEPSQFCIIVSGACFWSVCVLGFRVTHRRTRIAAFAILFAMLLTFSALLVPSLLLVAILAVKMRSRRPAAYLQFVLSILLCVSTLRSAAISDRVTGVIDLATSEVGQSTLIVHGSSEVFYDHYRAAMYSLKRNALTGAGLGMHENVYRKYRISEGRWSTKAQETLLNVKDANSMLLRIISELGLFGVAGVIALLARGWMPSGAMLDFRIISSACLCIMGLQLVRQGNYVFCYFPMYFLWYLMAKRQATNRRRPGRPVSQIRRQKNVHTSQKHAIKT